MSYWKKDVEKRFDKHEAKWIIATLSYELFKQENAITIEFCGRINKMLLSLKHNSSEKVLNDIVDYIDHEISKGEKRLSVIKDNK